MFSRALVIVVLFFAALTFAQGTKRLILKNGSYQVVQKYEMKGDRVRYFSAERYEWEELPQEMVDWDATRKYESEQAKAAEPPLVVLPTKAELERQAEAAMTPEVAPKLRLPKTGGVFAIDTIDNQPQLVELTQNAGRVDEHIGRNLLLRKVTKISPNTQTVELSGPKAKVQIHVPRPVIYINVDTNPDDPNAAVARKNYQSRPSSDAYRFVFVKLDQKRNARILGNVKTSVAEERQTNQTIVPTFGEIMDGEVWIKIEPKDDLPPGEYAVTETLPGEEINRYVWDFSITAAEIPKGRDTGK